MDIHSLICSIETFHTLCKYSEYMLYWALSEREETCLVLSRLYMLSNCLCMNDIGLPAHTGVPKAHMERLTNRCNEQGILERVKRRTVYLMWLSTCPHSHGAFAGVSSTCYWFRVISWGLRSIFFDPRELSSLHHLLDGFSQLLASAFFSSIFSLTFIK